MAPGSSVFGEVPDGGVLVRLARPSASTCAPAGPGRPGRASSRAWAVTYGAMAVLLSGLPIVAVLAGAALPVLLADEPTSYADLLRRCSPGSRSPC